MGVLLGIRAGYVGLCILFVGLSFWHRFFSYFHQLLIVCMYIACFAVVLITPYFNNYYNWPLLFDLNTLLAVFLMVFHDIRGFRYFYSLVCVIIVFGILVAVMNTTASSPFLYVTAALLFITNTSSTFTTERLLKVRFALVGKLRLETAKTDSLLHEMLPARIVSMLKDGTIILVTVFCCLFCFLKIAFADAGVVCMGRP